RPCRARRRLPPAPKPTSAPPVAPASAHTPHVVASIPHSPRPVLTAVASTPLTVRPATDILGNVTTRMSSLRAARDAQGWSQTEAARALGDLARTRRVPIASPARLKNPLSR